MPYPEGHKLKVRGAIVENAAKAFRSGGIRDISVPAIMKRVGLTHGGFYAHFGGKDELVAEACSYAVGETIAYLEQAIAETRDTSAIEAVIDRYLSADHRDHPELGCILPALSGEMPRLSADIRETYTRELQRMIGFVADLAGVEPADASALYSLLLGTLVLARSVSDAALSDRLLASGRDHAKALLAAGR